MKATIALILAALLFSGCIDDDNQNRNCNGVACTEIFLFLTVKVVDSDGQPVTLDSYKVILLETGVDITPDNSDNPFLEEKGTYVVFDDSYSDDYQNETTIIKFLGFIGSEEVANMEFTVGADCCHVKMISESNVVIID